MSGKGLPDHLRRARQQAMRRMAAQLGGDASDDASAEDAGNGHARGGELADAFGEADDAPASRMKPALTAFPLTLPRAADADVLWGGGTRRGVRAPPHPAEREAVLSAAAQLFAGTGFRRVSLEEVAQQAEVERAGVLSMCASKEDLLLQAAAWEVERFLALAHAWVDARANARRNLHTISERAFDYMGMRPLLLQLMLGALPELAAGAEARIEELRTRFVSIIEEALRLGVASGELRRELPVTVTAALLFDLHVAGYLLHTRPSPDKAERAARRREVALDLVLDGLRAKAPPPRE